MATALLALQTAPVAVAGTAFYASHAGPIYSGKEYVNVDFYDPSWVDIEAHSTGSAFSGVWISQFSGGTAVRVSADRYCTSAGCSAYEGWFGPYPSGYPTLHNHGNASPSFFDGVATY
jgi:hypothetical protein